MAWPNQRGWIIGKKIKRRLEDLERRAGSSSASPEQSYAELPIGGKAAAAAAAAAAASGSKMETGVKRQKSKHEAPNRSNARNLPSPSRGSLADDPREDSMSPPPSFGYSYPMPEPAIHAPYPQQAVFPNQPPSCSAYPGQPVYLPPLPSTLPSMLPYDLGSAKNDNLFDDDAMLNPYDVGYFPFTKMDGPVTPAYQDTNIHVILPDQF